MILEFIKGLFESEESKQVRIKTENEFNHFLEESKEFSNKATKNYKAELFRVTWKRAFVLKEIYEELHDNEKARLFESFISIAQKHFFSCASTNPYHGVKLTLSPMEFKLRFPEFAKNEEEKNKQEKLEQRKRHKTLEKERKDKQIKLEKERKEERKKKRPVSLATVLPNYELQNDQTALDSFLKDFSEFLGFASSFSISGLSGPPKKGKNRAWITYGPNCSTWRKTYSIKFSVPKNFWGMEAIAKKILENSSGQGSRGYYSDFLEPFSDQAELYLGHFLKAFDQNYFIRTSSIKSDSIHLWIIISLPISSRDIVIHLGGGVGQYSQNFFPEVIEHVEEEMKNNSEIVGLIYSDFVQREKFFRRIENSIRAKHGVPAIGEGHYSQTALFYLIKRYFPDAIMEYSPDWLNRQRFDIFLPNCNVAIEYHGEQHYKPIEYFGGQEGFKKNQERDKQKRMLAQKHRVTLIEWPYSMNISISEVERILGGFMTDEEKD